MREIKFRFIYSDGKRVILKIFTLAEIMNGEPFEVLSNEPFLKQFKMEGQDQFIGLYGKMGEEIYERDIVKAVSKNTPRQEVIGEILFGEGEYEVETNDDCWPVASVVVLEQIEVIGNTWENPDLLKEIK